MTAGAEPTEFLRVSYSSMNVFAACNRKFEFQKLYPKRVRQFDDNYAAEVGKALHAGYQEFLTNHDRDSATWALMSEFPYEIEFTQTNDFRSFEASLSTLEKMMDEGRMNDYELAKIVRPPSPQEVAAGLESGIAATPAIVPAIEVPFELRFRGITLPDGRGIAFTGFIDAIMQHYSTRAFRTLDIKTSRQGLADSTAKYKFDSQQIPYGVIVDHLAGEAIEAFEVLYLDSYVDLVDPRVTLYPFMKTREDIQEWATNKLLQFQSLQRFMANDYFPRTDNGCLSWQKPCAYLDPCMSRDRDALTQWFLMGEEPQEDRPFHPWVVADIDLGVA